MTHWQGWTHFLGLPREPGIISKQKELKERIISALNREVDEWDLHRSDDNTYYMEFRNEEKDILICLELNLRLGKMIEKIGVANGWSVQALKQYVRKERIKLAI